MRFPRMKLSVLSLMVAVAAVALLMALGIRWESARLRKDYLTQAAWHAQEERHWKGNIAEGIKQGFANPFTGTNWDYDNAAMAAYHSQMKLVFERPASQPRKSLPSLAPPPQAIRRIRRPSVPKGTDFGTPID
jgi:hypothetical protein